MALLPSVPAGHTAPSVCAHPTARSSALPGADLPCGKHPWAAGAAAITGLQPDRGKHRASQCTWENALGTTPSCLHNICWRNPLLPAVPGLPGTLRGFRGARWGSGIHLWLVGMILSGSATSIAFST